MNRRGIGLISALLTLTVVGVALAAFGLVLSQERARVRDARRVADMVRVQFAFETLFREKGSYAEAAAGCGQAGQPVSSCNLAGYYSQIGSLRDPGKGAYQIEQVPDDNNYVVSFTLERGYDALVPGRHVVTRSGIQ